MADDKIGALMHGLPVASESNVFPVIPDTDSFLLVPKSNDDGGNKADHHSLMTKDHGGVATLTNDDVTGHQAKRRFSTGDVAVPYTNVEILSRYLAAASKGSYHGYCKNGMGNEEDHEDEEADSSSTMKMFNNTLGKDHHDVLWNTAATLMERRKKMSPAKITAPSSTIGSYKIDSASNREELVSPLLAKKDNGHSPSRSGIGLATSPKPHRHVSYSGLIRRDNVSPFTKSRNPSLSKIGPPSSSTSQLGVDSHKSSQNPRRRSVSVSKVRTTSSELGISSTSSSLKPKKSETLVSPAQRRGVSMSKLAPSSSERSPTHHLVQRRSMLPGTKENRKVQPSSVGRSNTQQNRTERIGKVVEHNKSVSSSSPAKHKFLRRQTISEHVSSSTKRPTTTRLSNGHLKDIEHNNRVKKAEADEQSVKEVVKAKITAEKYLPLVSSSSSKHEPHKITQSSTMKVLKRTKYVQEYRNLRRTRARSVKSEPMGVKSKDMHSVNSSTESCETDLVLDQNALERIQESMGTTTTTTSSISTARRTSTRSGAINSGDHKEKQPKKLKSRPGRVIEFKYEITSPRRLKFKRTTLRHHDNSSSLSKVDIKYELLRKAEGIELTELDAIEEAGLRQQDIHEEKISEETTSDQLTIGDRKSKVKALVGAFESLITVQDSNKVPIVSE
ncbi:hypothetical protein LINGRAHAP2_LOCUS18238 [Linum grandiflorum]